MRDAFQLNNNALAVEPNAKSTVTAIAQVPVRRAMSDAAASKTSAPMDAAEAAADVSAGESSSIDFSNSFAIN
jgi:hypothetical protein